MSQKTMYLLAGIAVGYFVVPRVVAMVTKSG